MVSLIPVVISVGLALALYAFYVEHSAAEAKRLGIPYRALCDFGAFSCTKVFSSEFGSVTQFFGLPKIPNSVLGAAFYVAELLLVGLRWRRLLLLAAVASCFASVGLFYILTVKLHDFCVVCFSVYVVNFTTAFLTWREEKRAAAIREAVRSAKKL
jgi:vitamin-K-epoxide reductase (warfarin-sensitive)